jgi:hypothetical protein
MKKALKYEYDEVYVGTPEERAANNHADKDFADDVGHMYGGGFRGHAVGSHDALDGPIQSKDEVVHTTASKDPLDGDGMSTEEAV